MIPEEKVGIIFWRARVRLYIYSTPIIPALALPLALLYTKQYE